MNLQKDLEKFTARAKEMGAENALVINPATVVTAAWVRQKCMFGCHTRWRHIYCCPPYTPEPDQTRKVLDCYDTAILLHSNQDTLWKIVQPLEREIFLAGYYKAYGYTNGDCQFCRICSPEKCMHSDEARPSMEACGIDVFATARGNGLPINVVNEKDKAENYYGLILVE